MANLVWSVAENSDWRNHGQYWDLYNRYTINARNVMFAAIAIQGLWYLILRPLRLFDADLPREKAKDVKPPHLSFYFRTQREFEACHSLFWLLKDLAWNYLSIGLWIPTAILTALWALIYIGDILRGATGNGLGSLDLLHAGENLVWITGNIVWATGDLWLSSDQWVAPMFHRPPCPPIACTAQGIADGRCDDGGLELYSGRGIISPAGVTWDQYRMSVCPDPSRVQVRMGPSHSTYCEDPTCDRYLNQRWNAAWIMWCHFLCFVLLYGTWTALTLFGACERPGVTLQEVLEGNDVFQDADTEKAVDADKAAAVGIEVSPVRPGAEQGRGATA